MGSEFRYAIGKVLGTQDRPTLRLAFYHCVLYLNLIKNNLNTCILNLHTHTSMHLTHNHGIFILKQAYLSIHKAKENQTQMRNPNIHLAYENPIIHLKQGSNLTWQQDINILQTLIIHLSMFHHIIKVNHNTNAWTFSMHDIPFTYLAATQHLWHWCMDMWMHGMASKQENKRNPNLSMSNL